jgi:hypothetical protein
MWSKEEEKEKLPKIVVYLSCSVGRTHFARTKMLEYPTVTNGTSYVAHTPLVIISTRLEHDLRIVSPPNFGPNII